MKRANGSGCITKLSGNRRRPYAIKITLGYTEEGKLQYKYLSYHKTHREAEQALAIYNQDPYTLSKYTFKQLYDEFIATQEPIKAPATIRNHKAAIKHLEPLWNVKAQEIDRITLQQFYLKLNQTPSIVNNIHRTLQGVINYAVKIGVMPIYMLNVQKAIDMTPTKEGSKNEHTIITKEERAKLWENKDKDMTRLILVYIYTGLRYSELYNLTEDCIHDNYIEIKQSKTAAGVRIVPLCDRVRELLPVIEVPPYTTFRGMFESVLPNHTPHDTRHTFVTMLTEKGIDLRIIQAIVGHSRGRTVTELYTHITLDKMLEAVNTLDD